MSITFSCPRCGAQLAARDSRAGQQTTCAKCQAAVTVPPPDPGREGDAADDHGFLLMPSERKKHEDLIDMTAMVDIVFFLLIFFMVTSMQALESVIGLPSPQSSSAAPSATAAPDYANDPSFITVTIEADDTIWVEDEQVFGRQDLRIKLRNLRDEGFQPTGMMVIGNPEASHGQLVIVLDAGVDAGLEELRFSVANASGEPAG